MALNREDYLELLRYFQSQLHSNFPEIYEMVEIEFEVSNEPKQILLMYIRKTINVISERSSSNYRRILSILNKNVKTVENERINDILIRFSPEEQEVYGISELSLSNIQDFSTLLQSLQDIYEIIEGE